MLIVVLAIRIHGQHANLLWEVLEPGSLLRHPGKDKLLLKYGLGVVGHIELFV